MGLLMIVVLAALLFAALVAVAPVQRPPLSSWAFMIGFPAGELALQSGLVAVALASVGEATGWLHGSTSVVAWVLTALCVGCDSWLVASGLRARRVVDRALRAARGVSVVAAGPPQWLRWWRSALGVPLAGRRIRIVRDVAYVDDSTAAHRLDVISPSRGASGAPVMLYVHGGGWSIGSKRNQALPMLYELASRGWVCISINYRLSPAATWPDHIVDVKRAIAWTRTHAAEHGGDTSSFLAISGGSAGGHLAALAAIVPDEPAWQPGFEDADTSVDACVPLYGVLEMTGDPSMSGYLGTSLVTLLERSVMKAPLATARETYEAASPLHRLTDRAPAFLVVHGTKDSLVSVGVARAFVAAFRRACTSPLAYIELPGAQHAFDLLCSPRASATTRGIVSYLEALVAARATERA